MSIKTHKKMMINLMMIFLMKKVTILNHMIQLKNNEIEQNIIKKDLILIILIIIYYKTIKKKRK